MNDACIQTKRIHMSQKYKVIRTQRNGCHALFISWSCECMLDEAPVRACEDGNDAYSFYCARVHMWIATTLA